MRFAGPPSVENGFLSGHVELLCRSLKQLSGRDLIDCRSNWSAASRGLYEAPFVVVSHDAAADPVFNYGNRCALELFESSWEQFTTLPSRLSAEAPEQSERERLLAEVSSKGYIDNYSGVRISRGGRRFRIDQALVWNLVAQDGVVCGQAATFDRWEFL